jgi:putative transposase
MARPVRKLWAALRRDGVAVGRDRVARLMRQAGLQGVCRGGPKRTTVPGNEAPRRIWCAASSVR